MRSLMCGETVVSETRVGICWCGEQIPTLLLPDHLNRRTVSDVTPVFLRRKRNR